MIEQIKEYPIHDILNYPTLFIRDGDFVFVADKHTGEISQSLHFLEAADYWVGQLKQSLEMQKYYFGNYFSPKDNPDTARTLKELKYLCSDSSRHVKGDSGYFLDFINSDCANPTQSKLFWWMCKKVEVWNYAVFTQEELYSSIPRTKRQIKTVVSELEEKKLIKIVTDRFEHKKDWALLVKVHPKLYWKGRYEAWATRSNLEYEYEDFLKGVNGNSISI